MRIPLLVMLIAYFSFTLHPAHGGEVISQAELVKKLELAHSQYRKSLAAISGEWTMQVGSEAKSANLQRFDILGTNVRTLGGASRSSRDAFTEVQSFNEQYFFLLNRQRGSQPWTISQVDKDLAKPPKREFQAFLITPPILLSQSIANVPLRDLLSDASFRLMASRREGGQLVIEFASGKLQCRPKYDKFVGTFAISDDEYMLVQSAKLTYQSGLRTVNEALTVDYDRSRAPPLASKIVSDSQIEGGAKLLIVHELNYLDEKPQLADFTLTAFGLPEPPGTTVLVKPTPYWLLATLAGVFLIGAAIFFRRKKAG